MIEKTYPFTEKLIANALHLAQQLHQALIHEADALKKIQQAELIGTIADSKKQLVAQLDQLNAQLTQILATEKLPNTPDSVKEYFKSAETAGLPTAESAHNWAQLMHICSECKRQNEENGASIDVLSRHTRRSLNIIKGKPESANTYDADGSTQSDHHTSPLISV
ncbi:MAG: flagellar protein FlgN [Methylobacter sp.]|nr:flagellar protein FlgN [Methylobacter sp.]MDP2097097.1 flagellar protein FlgN [Methylobacter sp.]MDP2428035.1 flagellar protein FlgN [Methylobacter sp.]MDP3055931.1 flagellar protein FlgN [Methylobacter sp.]MDP3363089.1 flagellar protein FlgN [Methylobacter sp.]